MTSKSSYNLYKYSAPVKKVEQKVRLLHRKEKIITPMLYDILSCVTPHPHYTTILAAIKKYMPKNQQAWKDGVGNLIVKVGKKQETLFSCHIDMVFRKSDWETGPKKLDLFISQEGESDFTNLIWGGMVTSETKSGYIYTPTTLGADDKAGIYIMLKLIAAKVPGLYIFHIGEEVGGIGSNDIKTRKPELLKNIKRAVAFDRMDYFDIIGSQRGGECCSLEFISAFGKQLDALICVPNNYKSTFKGAVGTFTDTANYTDLVPECTNLSVGYFSQHGPTECLDTNWLENTLTPALLKVDWDVLPTVRSTEKPKLFPYYTSGIGCSSYADTTKDTVRKYVTYGAITYNTPTNQLPPWTLSKGFMTSATDIAMRRLIKNYCKNINSEFTMHNEILDMLKENANLKKQVVTLKTSDKKCPTVKELYGTICDLAGENFAMLTGNCVLYDVNVLAHAELLEWAWKDIIKDSNESTMSVGQLSKVMQEILMEILIVNTTLLEDTKEINLKDVQVALDNVDESVVEVVINTIKFFKENWSALGYENYGEVQDEFKQIRLKIKSNN